MGKEEVTEANTSLKEFYASWAAFLKTHSQENFAKALSSEMKIEGAKSQLAKENAGAIASDTEKTTLATGDNVYDR
ncbi:hypothetical protein ACFLU4_04790 [Chloroflexota bacterium]